MLRTFLIVIAILLFASCQLAQMPNVASGTVKRFPNFKSKYIDPRNVDVWLPEGYSAKKKYAVLYMHDGQMLFDAATTWNKQEWQVDEIVGGLLKERRIRDVIVVGVWNTAKRHLEYFPQKPWESLSESERARLMNESRPGNSAPLLAGGPFSDKHLKFLVEEVKPFIDRNFSTRKDKSNTFVAGSSMGGLISMYAISEYPDVLGGAACLSTHWPGIFRPDGNPVPDAFFAYMRSSLPSPKGHRLYFDYGTETLDALYEPFQLRADEVIKGKGYTEKNWMTHKFPGEDHSEKAWAKRLAIPLEFLLGKDRKK